MSKVLVAVAGLAMAGAANAQVFNFGNTGVLAGFNAAATQNFNVASGGSITGFTITADMQTAGGGSWQSDMKLEITAPGGAVFSVGPTFGNTTNTAWNQLGGTGAVPPNTTAAGPLSMSFPFAFGSATGNWTVRLSNGWTGALAPDTVSWNNVVITLVPTPASAALLGLGGLVALRRRR